MSEFLLELLSEEIPARMQARAAEDLKRLVCEGLDKAQLSYGGAHAYVTPRRLALVVDGLPQRQPDVREERKGPRVGSPEKAVEGFVRAAGLASVAEADVRETDKGSFYFAVQEKPGAPTATVIINLLREVLAGLPWPKSMRWGGGSFRWVRPLQSIIALFDGAPIAFTLPLGENGPLAAGAATRGHRFLAPAEITVRGFADYRDKLRAAKVLLDPAERRALIAERAAALAAAEGLSVREDEALLDEVTGLVEWPVPMLGNIDSKFENLPPEVLIAAMRTHQKYFSLLDAAGKAPRFVLVANTEATDGGQAIVAGNERVLRARLSDAKFFWDEDRKRTLKSRVPKLAERVFHAKLGSDLQRSERLAKLAHQLAHFHPRCDAAHPKLAEHAARLCKADLTSQMVGEFPELQGVMGAYYAQRNELLPDEHPDVAEAIGWHYKPQGPSDKIPTTPVAVAVALADKIDTLVGFFAIGEKPTGSRDPYALRRAALGAIRIIRENDLRIPLRPILHKAYWIYISQIDSDVLVHMRQLLERSHFELSVFKQIICSGFHQHWLDVDSVLQMLDVFVRSGTIFMPSSDDEESDLKRGLSQQLMLLNKLHGILPLVRANQFGELERLLEVAPEYMRSPERLSQELLDFLADRLKVHLREQGVRHDLIAAVFASGAEDDIVRLLSRVDALRAFLNSDDGANLLVAYRRASNIVRIEENKDSRRYEGEAEEALFTEIQEIELHRALSAARAGIGRALDGEQFGEAMTILAALRAPVDAFFDHVKVNCPDADLRINRLKLLSQIRSALGRVADFSQIEG